MVKKQLQSVFPDRQRQVGNGMIGVNRGICTVNGKIGMIESQGVGQVWGSAKISQKNFVCRAARSPLLTGGAARSRRRGTGDGEVAALWGKPPVIRAVERLPTWRGDSARCHLQNSTASGG